jgi:thiol-disulfide isomerase/thioredoxin
MWREALRTHELPRVEFGERFLALAREYPRDPVAVDCLLWINSHALASPRYYEIQSQILDLIARNQLDSEKMASVLPWWCFGLGCDGLADGERFLRIVLEKSRRRESRGIAALSLGYCLKRESEIVEGLRAGLEFGENTSVDLVAGQSADRIKELKAMDPEKIGREAEQVLHLAENQYGDVPWKNHRMTIGEGARQLLHEIAHLGLGKEAPEIDGEDLDGQKLRLCDFRGKVVVLSFWASWCGPCMRLVPHERAMVKHFAGKPFVLLGINGDTTRQAAKNSAAKNEISWRSWWDGNHGEGPIAKQWNVMAWPAIYILDKHGVIRRRPAVSGQWDAIEKAVEKLLDHAN